MIVRVLAFGVAKEIFGVSHLDVELSKEPSVGELKCALEHKYPRLASLSSYMVAVNNEYANNGLQVNVNDEVAIIPPVSGG